MSHDHPPAVPSRRAALRTGLGAAAALVTAPRDLLAVLGDLENRASGASTRPYLDAAVRAARWLEATAIQSPQGVTWAGDPTDTKTVQNNLYSGSPGVVLFLLELHGATGERRYLDLANSGADYLAAAAESDSAATDFGLYTGVAGVAFTLAETSKRGGRAKHMEAARRATAAVRSAAAQHGAGVQWSETTDIISGGAGIGLFLLYAAHAIGDAAARDVAVKAGHRLVELGKSEGGGIKWSMRPDFPRNMPNFSHGTAGVAYYLATLHKETGDKSFLDAAVAGATYLQSIATPTSGDGRVVFHHEPDGKELFYLSWCHGPAGTARLFHRLAEITGDKRWGAYVKQLVQGVLASGIPEQRTAGFWNNVSQCCGDCGVAEFFIALHSVTKDDAHLAQARRFADDTLRRATDAAGGLKWIQAEHRVRPELLIAQTGLMQGAAGVGLAMLHLDSAIRGGKGRIVLPDSPFT